MVALLKSKEPKRTIRCDQVFHQALSSPHFEVINDSQKLTDYLLKLCDKKMDSGECALRESMEPLYQLFQGRNRISEKVLHSLIRGVPIQGCSAGAKIFTNYVFCHAQFSSVIQDIENCCATRAKF